jgi:hypothetical protein
VRDRVGADLLGDLDLFFRDQRPRDRRAEQVLSLIEVFARNIGNTYSRTNSSRRSLMKMFSGLMPSSSA